MKFGWYLVSLFSLFACLLLVELDLVRAQDDDERPLSREKRFINSNGWTSISESFHRLEDEMKQRSEEVQNWPQIKPGEAGKAHSAGRESGREFIPVVVMEKGQAQPREAQRQEGNRNWFLNRSPYTLWSLASGRPWMWSGFNFGGQQHWWKGSNVCVDRKVIEESEASQTSLQEVNATSATTTTSSANGNNNTSTSSSDGSGTGSSHNRSDEHSFVFNIQSTQCSENENSYICTTKVRNSRENKTSIVKYQCCHGFKRKMDGDSGCEQIDLKDIVTTLRETGAQKMVKIADNYGLTQKLRIDNLTVFAPSNEAFIDFEEQNNRNENDIQPIVDNAEVKRMSDKELSRVLSRHLIHGGIYRSSDFYNDQIVQSINNESIRINVYNSEKAIITANCARVTSANNFATNGVYHLIDRVMPTPSKTLAQIIETDTKFSIFKEALEKVNLFESLRNPKGHFTVFAATNKAFDKLEKPFLEKLKSGQSCAGQILQSHVVPHVLCSSALTPMGEINVRSLSSYVLTIATDYENKLHVEDAELIVKDILGTNGVVHVIDKVIFPKTAQLVTKSQTGLTDQFFKLLNETSLTEDWDSVDNATFFLPTNEAFNELTPDQKEMLKKEAKMILKYHLIPNYPLRAKDFYNNELLDTANGKSVRVNLHEDFPGIVKSATAQCGKIVYKNQDVCNGVVHIVSKVLFPPKNNLLELLDSMKGFTLLRRLIKETKMEGKLQNETGPFTLLAPPDDVFYKQLTEDQINELIKNAKKAERILKMHLIPEIACCSGINMNPFPFSISQQYRTMDGSVLTTRTDLEGRVRFGSTVAIKCDSMAQNGVIHVINKVLQPRQSYFTSSGHSGLPQFASHPILGVFL